ncbi:MAG: purine-nucleoside phosphorylase [bacterium]|nr:purine-nucleoside phosphorylase [bacterium]MDT8365711.1 purine-nucleoside phosphorylase [bacterium]
MNREELKELLFGAGAGGDPGPEWGMVLGSGFDVWVDHLSPGEKVPFGDVDGVPPATAPGHTGYFTAGRVGGKPVVVAVGRLHLYEGFSAIQTVEPVRIMESMGITGMVLTTAVGSVYQDLAPGDGVVVKDQLNLTGEDPHRGAGRFPDVSGLYDRQHLRFLRERGFKQGVLAGVKGPSYETPAEVRVLETMGADIVCMSTVLEALALAGTKVRCVGVAVVANRAGRQGTTHDEVLEVIGGAVESFWQPVSALIGSGSG